MAKWRGILFHQISARTHTPIVTSQNLRELGWDGLVRSLYRPDDELSAGEELAFKKPTKIDFPMFCPTRARVMPMREA